MDLLSNLNDEQLEAVTTTEGYVRVIAGAGSGKTKTLTHRYAYLVNDLGISTANILCITFTNKAAREMKKRINTMIGDLDTGYVCTFHGMGVNILREDIHTINYPSNFVVMDTEDTEAILKTVYANLNINTNTLTFDEVRRSITYHKSLQEHIPYLMDLDNDRLKSAYNKATSTKQKVFYGYLLEQKKNFALDFDDLITIPLYIFKSFPDKRRKWQERMMYVMVDEFQDVSGQNYEFAEILSGYHKNLFIVGDPDQTIYSWRGAEIKHILEFDKEHPEAKTIKLYKNYRSTPEILDAANSLIKNNKNRIPNDIKAVKDSNVLSAYYHGKTTEDEAKWIGERIKALVARGATYDQFAVLYRSHFVSRSIEEVFIKEKLPYVLYSGVEFYKRKEIKDILSYLRMLVAGDDLSFKRVVNEPRRNIGKKRLEFLQSYADKNDCTLYEALVENMDTELIASTKAVDFVRLIEKYKSKYQTMSLSDLITNIIVESGYEGMLRTIGEDDRLENLAELKNSIFEYEKNAGEDCSLEDYLQGIALYTNSDKEEKEKSIKLMTIHIAKGLEFPYVFVCGMNEGIFPTVHADTEDKLEEERRLAYVAFTRAENVLFLTDAEGVNYDGGYRYPSRFIFNTDKQYLKYEVELEEKLINDTKKYISYNEEQLGLLSEDTLSVGDRVTHKVFGPGVIANICREDSSYVIKFDKFETERNLSFRAPLEKIN